jgi:hypothetical protein
MRSPKPKKAGEPFINSGVRSIINLDAGSLDRLTWLRNAFKRSALKLEAGNSILLRRSVSLYQEHIEKLIQKNDEEEIALEVLCLTGAAKGTTDPLPQEDLEAVPVRPFSQIRQEHLEAKSKERLTAVQNVMREELERWDTERTRGGRGG